MPSLDRVLLLGAGELGTAFLTHLRTLPNIQIIVAVRTVSKYTDLAGPNISLISLDHNQPVPDLAKIFANYDTIISCTGFGQPAGTQKRLTEAVLEAGKLRKRLSKDDRRLWYFPWQWGVDYDVTGDGNGLMPLFGEQLEVRNVLREKAAESNVKWTIVSTGIFMSFLFEPFWGVIERAENDFIVRALGSWDHKITVTTVDDIGKIVAKIVAGDVESEDRVVYIAGDTVSYAELAEIVERVTGKQIKREEWSIPYLKTEFSKDSEDQLKKYRVVFAGEGVWWRKDITANYKLQIPLTDIETWLKANFDINH